MMSALFCGRSMTALTGLKQEFFTTVALTIYITVALTIGFAKQNRLKQNFLYPIPPPQAVPPPSLYTREALMVVFNKNQKSIKNQKEEKNNKKKTTISSRLNGSGSVLASRAVASQVLSALKSLTSVFGMRTGGSSSPLPPLLLYIS